MKGYECECGEPKLPSQTQCPECLKTHRQFGGKRKRAGRRVRPGSGGGHSMLDWETYHLACARPIAGGSLEVLEAMLAHL